MTERIVEKLWANAKNVRHLPAGEHLTIAITFDGHSGSSQFGSWSSWLGAPANPSAGETAQSIDFATETSGDKLAGFTEDEAKAVREGDRLMAAGSHEEATQAYLTALRRVNTEGPIRIPASKLTLWTQRFPAVIENVKRGVAEVRRKASLAASLAGHKGDAKKWAAGADNVTLEPLAASPAQPRISERPGFTPEEVRHLTLGDLHLKQGKPAEAAQSYEQALARYKNLTTKVDPPSNLSPAQVQSMVAELQSGVRSSFKQLAQAYLAAGDTEKAAAALELARNFTAQLPSRAELTLKGVHVPAKLVISIAKADTEKATTEEAFRKAVKVEVTGFPPADKPKQP
jgi:tetratricopeptide (TPR) repeat protein